MTDTPRDYSWLPKIYRNIARIAGLEAALAIGRARGGQTVRFSAKAGGSQWLRELVGPEAAKAILSIYSAEYVTLPLPPDEGIKGRRRRAEQALDAGATVNEAARISGRHARSIHRYRAKRREIDDPDMPDLFGGKKL